VSKGKYRILRKTAEGEWINLYPPVPGRDPPTYEDEEEAEDRALRIKKKIGVQTKVVTVEEALEHEQPKKEYS
jgi:hypothetical protein